MAIHKCFLCEIWGIASFGVAKVSMQSAKVFSTKIVFITNAINENFLPQKFPVIRHDINQVYIKQCLFAHCFIHVIN